MVNPAKQSNAVAFFDFQILAFSACPRKLSALCEISPHCLVALPPSWMGRLPISRTCCILSSSVTFPPPTALLILSVVLTQQDDSPTKDIKELLQPTSTFLRANLSTPKRPNSSVPGLVAPSRGQPSNSPTQGHEFRQLVGFTGTCQAMKIMITNFH